MLTPLRTWWCAESGWNQPTKPAFDESAADFVGTTDLLLSSSQRDSGQPTDVIYLLALAKPFQAR